MDLIVPLVSVILSLIAGLFAVYVSRQKGLPAINAEIEGRIQTLNDTLDAQLEVANREITALKNYADECKRTLAESQRENERLARREIVLTRDLLELYQKTGYRPPQELIENGKKNGLA